MCTYNILGYFEGYDTDKVGLCLLVHNLFYRILYGAKAKYFNVVLSEKSNLLFIELFIIIALII